MALSYRTEQRVAGSADLVLGLMVDQQTHEELLGSMGTKVESYSAHKDGDRLHTVVTTAEPAMQGATTHRSTLEATWDLPARTCTWSRRDHTFGDRVRAEGRTVVEPRPDGTCTVVETGEIDVRVPVIGKKIMRKVVDGMKEAAPRKAAFWEQKLRG